MIKIDLAQEKAEMLQIVVKDNLARVVASRMKARQDYF